MTVATTSATSSPADKASNNNNKGRQGHKGKAKEAAVEPATATPATPAAAATATPEDTEAASAASVNGVEGVNGMNGVEGVDASTPVIEGLKVEVTEPDLAQRVVDFMASMKQLQDVIHKMANNMKHINRDVQRLGKAKSKKGTRKGSSSNLIQQHDVSDELNAFFNKEPGTKWRRADITRVINDYAKTEKLKAADNQRVVIINPALATLMKDPSKAVNPDVNTRIELFTMLSHLKHHIHGNAKATDAAKAVGFDPNAEVFVGGTEAADKAFHAVLAPGITA